MRSEIELLRSLVALGDEAKTIDESHETLQRWLTLVGRLIAEAGEYVDAYDGRKPTVVLQ